MLRLTGRDSDETLRLPLAGEPRAEEEPVGNELLRFDSTRLAEHALDQTERRMRNLMDLVQRFGLDEPGEGPRVA